MKRRYSLLLLLALAPLFCGCAQKHTTPEQNVITIYGSGATFPQPQIEKWISLYEKINPNIKIEYQGKGSGGGQNDFKEGLVDFAATDPPVKENLWRELERKGQPLQFPIIVGAVVVVYNVPGVDNLRLDGKTLADIFMGKIEYWDDPAIKALNPNANLPHEKIIIIHRSDSSGTTKIFTTYLCLVSEEFEKKVGSGKLVNWPVDELGRGLGGKGNAGVVATLKQTRYSIAYTELAYALKENLKMVALKNKAGKFVIANETTIKSAVGAVKAYIPSPEEGYKEDIRQFLNAEGENSYPIVAFSHILLWKSYPKEKAGAIKEFFTWVLTEGQKSENVVEGYVGLPKDVAEIGLKAVQSIEGV
ncbi:phosphate ABC transporter substrate-binding protein PstS [Archaeoglobus profundus]|uniref:Phosphate-binding protein n=1 Tax=Archaeoglobus profundus (strain DSM 5631 / JCM 9629 / NBRC 100127 / Av18) TaxID=572546 RepID=D2RFU4_ARCPA|nr:phosphate ABC transporter substrate-binding protein PstS [Archaeoglobus profundus]ADB57169.1 phosphate ABC transporter, periplasmic phosphate- binding protein [Archaeoglobus profundus DSM 5631]